MVDGRPLLVKGVHYGPWRPGTGPNKDHPYPPLEGVDEDFALIRRSHANTVLVVDAPAGVLDLADRHGLEVLYCFSLNWYAVGGPDQAALRHAIAERVRALEAKPALLGWLLGNEIPEQALQQRGEAPIIDGLRDLYRAVKAADPRHPVSHANWPPTKDLDLGFFDFISFNLYPLWPPEVVAAGFGPYIARVLRPLAHGKPLLLSEFGVNSIEAGRDGQARLLRGSWDELRAAGAAGGVVFEFADEWWKNYDNPIRPGNWWFRESAPDDEVRADEDPEESYGILDAYRRPKPAYATVSEMFKDSSGPEPARALALIGIGGLVLLASGAWLRARRASLQRARRRGDGAAARRAAG